ncbi:MAG: diacylglycerol kinase family lipid kinase [Planctomycetes bacterium]|nr:diacylglycerol kinase family lipid kinase [Planctomycetota bacterium]
MLKVIVNPIAGSGKAKRFLAHLASAFKQNRIDYEFKLTSYAGEAKDEAARATAGTSILCLGGDGTINEIINGLVAVGSKVSLGIIPFGSGNVIAKELDLSRNINGFIRLYQGNEVMALDVGSVSFGNGDKRYFISMAGVGFDAEVARQYHEQRAGAILQAHLFSYFPIALKTIPFYRMPKMAVEVDGQKVTDSATFVQVANGRSYGGPFVFAGNASPRDGMLDIIWFDGRNRFNILFYYGMAFLGNGSLHPDARQIRGKKIRVISQESVPLQVDGDCCGYLPAEIEIIPGAVSVFARGVCR